MAGVKGRSGGHNRKSADQHRIEGTFRRDRHDGAPAARRVGTPLPPMPLGPIAQAAWDRLVRDLRAAGTLTRDLAPAIYQYARLFEEAEQVIADRQARHVRMETLTGLLPTLEGESRITAIATLTTLETLNAKTVTQLRLFALALKTYLVEFGLTPVSRRRVEVVRVPPTPARARTPLEKLQAAKRTLQRDPPLRAV